MKKKRVVFLALGLCWLISLVGINLGRGLLVAEAATKDIDQGHGAIHNLIPGDSSFELGFLANTFVAHQSFDGSTAMKIDSTKAAHGKQSLRLEFRREGDLVFGKHVPTEVGQTYTFSLYAKGERGGERAQLMLMHRGWRHVPRKVITLTDEWKRFSLTVEARTSGYALAFLWLGEEGLGNIWGDKRRPIGEKHLIWVDAYQLERGDRPTPYKNKEPISVGVHISPENDLVFFPDEEIKIDFTVYRAWPETEAEDLTLFYRITDFKGRRVKEKEERIALDEEGRFKKTLFFEPGRLGLFVVRAWIEEAVSPIITFAVVRPPVEIKEGITPFSGVTTHHLPGGLTGLKRMGSRWIQVHLIWDWIEREEGKFDWSYMDRYRRLKEAGWKIKAFTFNSFPTWTWDPEEVTKARNLGIHPSRLLPSREYLPAWQNFIREAAIRYKDVIDIWEIGGECDLTIGQHPVYRAKYPEAIEGRFVLGPVTDRYAETVRIAVREILSVIPEARVGAIRPSGVDSGCTPPLFTFSRDVFRKGVGELINLFPTDPYCFPRYVGPGLHTKMPDDFLPCSIREAQALTREFGGFPVSISEFGWGFDKDIEPDSFYAGEMVKRLARSYLIARREGVLHLDWHTAVSVGYEADRFPYGLWIHGQPMATVPAFSAVAQIVENVTEVKEIDLGPGIEAVIFKKPDGANAAIWAVVGEGMLTITAEADSISILDVMGNPVETEVKGKEITFRVDGFPVYLSMKENALEKLSQIIFSGKIRMPPVRVAFTTPRITRGFVSLTNQADEDLTAKVSLYLPGREKQTQEVQIPRVKSFPVEVDFILAEELIKREARVEVDIAGFDKVVASFPLKFEKAKKVAFPVRIDGDLSEWKDFPYLLINKRGSILPPDPWVAWSGPRDLSARVYVGWDRRNLYLAVEVTDDKHFNNQTGRNIWDGDVFQFAFDPHVDAALGEVIGFDRDDSELGIALTRQGKVSYQWFGERDIWAGSEFAVVRDEAGKKTFYEIKIPLRSLRIFPRKGNVFGFSFAVPDDDEGGGKTYWLELTSGIVGAEKNPRFFRKFVLSE